MSSNIFDRYELHSSISNENFRDIWKHINQHAAQCCSIESYETHDSQNKQLKTGSLESPEFEKLNGKVNVLNKAFADEKKTVREKIESMKTTLKEFNRTCVAEIERLKMESGQTNDGLYNVILFNFVYISIMIPIIWDK
jgi:hypothetical protein